MASPLTLGIDEGTTAVKAVLFDERLQPVREARRDKENRHPQPGWVEQDGEEVLTAVVEAVAELLEEAPGEVVACGLDHQGESVLAWDAETGKPLSPIVVWQDKRSQEVLDRLAAGRTRSRRRAACPSTPTSPRPSSPGCWSTTSPCSKHRRRAGSDGHCRFVPLRSPRGGVRHRRLDDLPHSAPHARRPASIPPCARSSACRSRYCPRYATRSATWACSSPRLAGGAAPDGPDRRSAGRARRCRLRRARPCQGHLRHRRLRARPRG